MADAYLKVKDNNGTLSLVREESDTSVTDLKNALSDTEGTLFNESVYPTLNVVANKGLYPSTGTNYNNNDKCGRL